MQPISYLLRIVKHSVLIVMASGFGFLCSYNYHQGKSDQREVAIAARETTTVAYMALFSARHRGLDEMLAGLEGTLDHGLVYLWENIERLSYDEQKSVCELIKKIKSYRSVYPRDRKMDGNLKAIQVSADGILANCTNDFEKLSTESRSRGR